MASQFQSFELDVTEKLKALGHCKLEAWSYLELRALKLPNSET
jgi:hypothetical protein